ncbi:unnamed protein product [Adineta steineri]|uniref:RickCE-like catalytic domain-containing protein n=1 Tax=Adineta steineri TaxID=433720 RepID=A0A816CHV0_9BILA|nr:unnamed protein product [Adineta steineri]
MAVDADLADQPLENVTAQSLLSNRLEQFKQDKSEKFSKSTYLLTTVDEHIDGQLKERLEQAKMISTGERIILFPYNLGNSHWIGLIIKFKMNEEIEHARFIDPVENSEFLHANLQNLFSKIFPDTYIRSIPVQHQVALKHSALFIIDNLVREAALFETPEPKSSNENHVSYPSNDDQQPNFFQDPNRLYLVHLIEIDEENNGNTHTLATSINQMQLATKATKATKATQTKATTTTKNQISLSEFISY